MTKKKEIELARKFFDLIFREVENGEDVIYDFINPECRYKTLCDKLNNETVKEVLELGFKQKYGEEWHGGRGEQDNVNPLYDAKAVGNAAAMREVLEALSAWANIVKDNPKDKTAMECVEFIETVVSSALAEPPRNCDRFATVKDAAIAFARERQDAPHPCPDFIFSTWLYAPSTEHKGDNNGSK